MKVSVVMPVYNVEKFVDKAINSVLKQTYENFELILVNDKSTDKSLEILKKYEKVDSRIKVVDKPVNEGLGYARNSGMEVATGDYIYFIDSDDYIESTLLEECVNSVEKNQSDVVIFGYSEDQEKDGITTSVEEFKPGDLIAEGQEFKEEFCSLYEKTIIHSTCNKFYKLDLLRNHNLKFLKVSMCEDIFFNLQFFKIVGRVTIINNVFYHYMKRNIETLIVKYNSRRFEFMCDIHRQVLELVKEYGVYTNKNVAVLSKVYFRTIIFCIIQAFNKSANLSKSKKIEIVKDIVNNDLVQEALKFDTYFGKSEKVYAHMIARKNIHSIYYVSNMVNLLKSKLNGVYRRIK